MYVLLIRKRDVLHKLKSRNRKNDTGSITVKYFNFKSAYTRYKLCAHKCSMLSCHSKPI